MLDRDYQMTPLDRLVYDFAAAARILKVGLGELAALTPQPGGCWVEFQDRSWQAFIPQREFVAQFASDRRASAKDLAAVQHSGEGDKWTVWEPGSGSHYEVALSRDSARCSCPDWEELSRAFGHSRVCCQHGYCVLAQLKFDSLKDYLKAWQPGGRLAKMRAVLGQKKTA